MTSGDHLLQGTAVEVTLKDLFLTLRTEDLDQLSELIERARSKADSLHAFTAAADLREIN